MKKIVLTAATISGNKGAEVMLTSTIRNLSEMYDDIEFSLLSYYKEKDRKVNPFNNLKVLNGSPLYMLLVLNPLAKLFFVLRKLGLPTSFLKGNKEIKAIAEADLVIDIAGISFALQSLVCHDSFNDWKKGC